MGWHTQFHCDKCGLSGPLDEWNRRGVPCAPAGWVHTMMGDDLCPDCQGAE